MIVRHFKFENDEKCQVLMFQITVIQPLTPKCAVSGRKKALCELDETNTNAEDSKRILSLVFASFQNLIE